MNHKMRFRFNVQVEFEGPPGTTLNASRKAGAALGRLINKSFQDREGELFLSVKEIEQVTVLTKKKLVGGR